MQVGWLMVVSPERKTGLASVRGDGVDERRANARLVAAAPEMYDWLREIALWHREGLIALPGNAYHDLDVLLARIDGNGDNDGR